MNTTNTKPEAQPELSASEHAQLWSTTPYTHIDINKLYTGVGDMTRELAALRQQLATDQAERDTLRAALKPFADYGAKKREMERQRPERDRWLAGFSAKTGAIIIKISDCIHAAEVMYPEGGDA